MEGNVPLRKGGQLDTEGMWLVEGRETSLSPVLVARAVVTQAQQSVPIRILNLGNGDVTLYGGSKVATWPQRYRVFSKGIALSIQQPMRLGGRLMEHH